MGVVTHFVGFVLVVREDDVGFDQVLVVDGAEITECEGAVLVWG